MANCCCFTMTITFQHTEDADACEQFFNQLDTHDGNYISPYDWVIFGAPFALRPNPTTIMINGDVKWYIDADEFMNFVDHLVKDFHVDTLRCTYSEPGCELFGYWEYVSDTGLLVDHRVSDAFIKKAYKEYDIENDDDALDKFLALMWNAPEDAYYEIMAVQLC